MFFNFEFECNLCGIHADCGAVFLSGLDWIELDNFVFFIWD